MPMNCSIAPSTQNCANPPQRPVGMPIGQINRSFDYTHLGENGAKYFSAIMAKELAKAVPELSENLIP